MIAIGRNLTGLTLAVFAIGSFVTLAFGLLFLKLSPITVAGLLVGGAVVAVCALRPYLGVHVMLALTYFEGTIRISENLTLTKVLGGLIMIGWMANAFMQRQLRHVFSRQAVLVGLYLAWCALSMTRALDPDVAMSPFQTYVLLGLSMIMIGSVVDSPQRLYRLLFALAFWTTVTALIALGMYYAGQTEVAVGLIGGRNMLAVYINVGVIAALLVYRLTQGAVPRLVLLVGVPVQLLALALTLSRTGLIVLLVALVSVWYRLARERGFMVLLGSTLACLALVLLLPGEFWRRAGTIMPSIERQEDTFGMRIRLWAIGLRIIEDHPFLGVGPGNFIAASTRYSPAGVSGYRPNSHSTYVGTATETGLVGLALLLSVVASAMVGTRRAIHAARQVGRSDLALAGVIVETMILSMMLSGITGNVENVKLLWIVLGMGTAFIAIARTTVAGEAPSLVPDAAGEVRPVEAT